MRIVLLSRFDLADVGRGSGSFHTLAHHLGSLGHELLRPPPVDAPVPSSLRWADRLDRRLRDRRRPPHLSPRWVSLLGRRASEAVATAVGESRGPGEGVDPTIWVLANDPALVSYLETPLPVALVTDALLGGVVSHGGWERYAKTAAGSLAHGLALTSRALSRLEVAFLPSRWAAASAVEDHGADPGRVEVVPWGPNLPAEILPAELTERSAPTAGGCLLLFVGTDWRHKRGELAVRAVERLRADGIAAELTVVGPDPGALPPLPAWVRVETPVDKRRPGDIERLARLYRQAHLLVLPSRAESYGVVFVEAAAFALPSMAPDHSGISSCLGKDGVGGVLLPPPVDAARLALAVRRLIEAPDTYQRLVRRAYAGYRRRANWPRAASEMVASMKRRSCR